MRVLHVEAGRHVYGGGRQVLLLASGLQARGIDTHLVCPRGSAIATEAGGLGLAVTEIPWGGDLDLAVWARLVGLIRHVAPDLVHVHSRRGADVWAGLAARTCQRRAVLSRRVDNPLRPGHRWLMGRAYARVITISAGIREVLTSAGVPPARVRCVPSAVELAAQPQPCRRAQAFAALGLRAEDRPVGMVAQLIRRKGHDVLLQALPQVIAREPRLRVLLFGRGKRHHDIAARVAKLGLTGHVRLLGYREDLPQLLPCLEFLVHPAWMEGLGVSLLQAGGEEIPAIATRVGGIPEVIVDGVTGALVAPGDADALAARMIAWLADPALVRAYGRELRAHIRSRFSLDAMVEGNLAVYREVLAES